MLDQGLFSYAYGCVHSCKHFPSLGFCSPRERSSLPARGCVLSPCTTGSSLGSPGPQGENMGVNLGRIAGCFDHLLSIEFANEGGERVQPPGTLGSWAWQRGGSLSVAVESPLVHISCEIPLSLMLLGVLGCVCAYRQRITCWSCLVFQSLP